MSAAIGNARTTRRCGCWRILRESGPAYALRYLAAFVFMFIFAGQG